MNNRAEAMAWNSPESEAGEPRQLTRQGVEEALKHGDNFDNVSLVDQNLAELDFNGKNFRHSDIRGLKLHDFDPDEDARHERTEIIKSDWTDAVISDPERETDFSFVQANGAKFGFTETLATRRALRDKSGGQIDDIGDLCNFNASDGIFNESQWKNLDFCGKAKYRPDFRGAWLNNSTITGCDLSRLDLSRSFLTDISIINPVSLDNLLIDKKDAPTIAKAIKFTDQARQDEFMRTLAEKGDQKTLEEYFGIVIQERVAEPNPFIESKHDDEKRTAGLAKMAKFIERTLGSERLADSSVMLEYFSGLEYRQFTDLLKRLNGIINDVFPSERRAPLEKQSHVVFGGDETNLELVPPSPEISQKILEKTFEKIRAIAKDNDQNAAQRVARTLYNSIIYLHSFPDGNGRTARLLYYLFSPHIGKGGQKISEQLPQVVGARKDSYFGNRVTEVDDYHWVLGMGIYADLLRSKGISDDVDKEGVYVASLKKTEGHGFDVNRLGFIAAYEAMDPDERIKYAHKVGENGAFNFSIKDFPKPLKERIAKQKDAVREEFTRAVLQASASTDEWPDWLDESLDKIFTASATGKDSGK